MKTALLLLALAAITFSIPARARGANPAPTLNLDDVPAVLVDEIAIPIPREIFVSLDKLEHPGWRKYIRLSEVKVPANRGEIALLFGLVIANGFVAVEAEHEDEVIKIGRDVLRLANALGVKSAVVMHTQSIIEGAQAREWMSVRRELDLAQEGVRDAMKELRDDDIAELVSIGGWLGGTEVLAAVLRKSYTEEGSDLLHQPELVAQISARFNRIPDTIRNSPIMEEIARSFDRLGPLLKAGGNGSVSEKSVAEIGEITAGLVSMIYQQNLKSGGDQ